MRIISFKNITPWLLLVAGLCPINSFAVPSCSFNQINGTLVDFAAAGNYVSGQSADIDASGDINMTCTDDDVLVLSVPVTVSIDAGNHGSIGNRAMSNGIDTLSYRLFADASRMTIFGDGITGSTVAAVCTVAVTCTVPVYGRVLAGQFLTNGSYSDDVLVTVDF